MALPCSKAGQQGDGFETLRFAVTVHPSLGRVFARHPSCQGFGMCNNVFAVGPLDQVLLLAAELKKTVK